LAAAPARVLEATLTTTQLDTVMVGQVAQQTQLVGQAHRES